MGTNAWRFHWHRFIDHLADGKDAESFLPLYEKHLNAKRLGEVLGVSSGAQGLSAPPHRLQLRGSDRALLVWMTWLWPSLLGVCAENSIRLDPGQRLGNPAT